MRIGAFAVIVAGIVVSACGGDDLTLPGEGVPAELVPVRGNGQAATAGDFLPDSLVVIVRDGRGDPLGGIEITWELTGGGDVVPGARVRTDAAGRAAVLRRLGDTVGEQTTVARIASPALQAVFSATAVQPPVGRLAFATAPPASVRRRAPIEPAPVVELREADGSRRLEPGVTVTVAVASGEGELEGPTTQTTDAEGRATFTGLAIDGDGPHTLIFAADGVTSLTTTVIDVLRGRPSASRSTIEVTPETIAASGGDQRAEVRVTVRDDDGAPVEGAQVSVAVSGSANDLRQPAGPTGADGVAVATVSSSRAGDRTVSATADGIALDATAGLLVEPGAASAAETTADVPDGYVFQPVEIVVTTRDEFGNPLERGGDEVRVRVEGSEVAVTDRGDGTYGSGFFPLSTGDYRVDVTLNGVAISGSPYSSTIEFP